MISGGLGALGSLMAFWLRLSGAKDLLLLGRSGHIPGQGTLLQSLLSSLQLVTVARCTKPSMLSNALALAITLCPICRQGIACAPTMKCAIHELAGWTWALKVKWQVA